ncbi:MAG: EH signature domain-containing protein [Pseudomonadota bacterium]|nr:EH signature domain-containing protein [Pseudomonadota bacterium]
MTEIIDLSAILRDPLRRTVTLPRIAAEPVATNRAAKAIHDRWPDVAGRELVTNPEIIVRKLLMRIRGNDWTDCYWSELCDAVRAICDTRKSLWREPEFAPVLDLLYQEIRRGEQPVFVAAAARAYVDSWDRKTALTVELAHRLLQRDTVQTDWFHHLATVCDLFNPDEVVGRLRAVLIGADNPYEAIRTLGLLAPHGPGLMQAVHADLLRHLDRRLQQGDIAAYRQLLDWIAPDGRDPMVAGAGEAIAAMLQPWVKRDPSDELRRFLEAKLVNGFGDPRISKSGAWGRCRQVAPEALDVFLRWLTEVTIRTFFDIIDRVTGSEMWKDRGVFWLDRYEKQNISEAWFALSDEGAKVAREMINESNGLLTLKFARNTSGAAQDREKSLLIFKDNGLWVVEGTHNFSVRIFSKESSGKITPYLSQYDCESIRYSERTDPRIIAIPHLGKAYLTQPKGVDGPWQRKVTKKIAEWSR